MNTPAEIGIGRQALTLIDRVLDAAAPEEGCALLLGVRQRGNVGPADVGPVRWHLRRVWPTVNVWEPAEERRQRFRIDPREQLLAQKWARAHGLEVLGSLHSHPASAPHPSGTDQSLTFAPSLMLIRGLAEAEPPAESTGDRAGQLVLRCWWLDENADPRLLPWRMED